MIQLTLVNFCSLVMFKCLSLWMKSKSVTIQMKATEQNFPVVLFILLYKMVQTFESVDETLNCNHSNEDFCAELTFCIVTFDSLKILQIIFLTLKC